MIRFEITRLIERPREEVFARLANIDGYNEWLSHSRIFRGTTVRAGANPIGPGTRFEDQTPVGVFEGEILEYVPPQRIAFRQILSWMGGPVFESRPAYLLGSSHAGTDVLHVAEGEVFGAYRLIEPYVRQLAVEERTRTLDALEQSFQVS